MSDNLKRQLPFIIVATILGGFMGAFAMTAIHDNAAMFNVTTFSIFVIGAPCVVMFVCAFLIMMTAREIGSRLFLIVEAICFILGMAATVVYSGWQSDPTIAAALLANSPEDTTITPIMNSPFGIVRNVLLYLLVPGVASIFGAWVGSRLHPMSIDKNNNSTPKKKQPNSKKRQG